MLQCHGRDTDITLIITRVEEYLDEVTVKQTVESIETSLKDNFGPSFYVAVRLQHNIKHLERSVVVDLTNRLIIKK